MESKYKHLELIQGVINRLSSSSFLLKGWSVVFVSAGRGLFDGHRATQERQWSNLVWCDNFDDTHLFHGALILIIVIVTFLSLRG